ncbi:MAG: hypothetical protein AB8D78_12430 [Akkermansiaceae bacterium]
MTSLPLHPLPAETSEQATENRRILEEGFIDEAVVRSVVDRGIYERVYAKSEDMVLSSDENDYAGWSLPVRSPFRQMVASENSGPKEPVRQPTPPALEKPQALDGEEPGISEPYTGTHRWWLFGISGAMSCALLSLTLMILAERDHASEIVDGYVPAIRATQDSADRLVAEPPAIQHALTRLVSED